MTSGKPDATAPGAEAGETCCPPAHGDRDAGWHRAAGHARLLSWVSLAYMAAEGVIAIIAAVAAGSVALLGFGLDSVIEGLASVIIVWRFTGTRTLSETAEGRAQGGRRHLLPVRALHRLRRDQHPRRR